ncbi:helix-turn-helix domain-containing protein [Streptomyces griseoviridis]|uniref:helix-turn-helix domain-containing protein n=1 Tax=Streptomyces griseoviridis TaxID=45398 RepID=UPI00344F49DC
MPPEVKQRFLELIHEGVSIREASRIVGINRRTGQEWVSGRGARVGTTKAGRQAESITCAARRTCRGRRWRVGLDVAGRAPPCGQAKGSSRTPARRMSPRRPSSSATAYRV